MSLSGVFRSFLLNFRLFSSLFLFAPASQLPFLISFLSAILPSTFDYLGVVTGFSQRWTFTWGAFRTTAFIIWIDIWAARAFWRWRRCWVQGILLWLSTLFLSFFLFFSFCCFFCFVFFFSFVFVFIFDLLLFGLLFWLYWIFWLCLIRLFFTIVRYALRHLCLNLVNLLAISLF